MCTHIRFLTRQIIIDVVYPRGATTSHTPLLLQNLHNKSSQNPWPGHEAQNVFPKIQDLRETYFKNQHKQQNS